MSVGVIVVTRESGWTSDRARVSLVVVNFVDRWFFLVWSRWPWYMAIDCGGYWRTYCEVSSGQLVKCPASMAVHQVDNDGEKQHA